MALPVAKGDRGGDGSVLSPSFSRTRKVHNISRVHRIFFLVLSFLSREWTRGEGGLGEVLGVLPIMDFTGRLCPKGIPLSG